MAFYYKTLHFSSIVNISPSSVMILQNLPFAVIPHEKLLRFTSSVFKFSIFYAFPDKTQRQNNPSQQSAKRNFTHIKKKHIQIEPLHVPMLFNNISCT